MAQGPLEAAGLNAVQVAVEFPWETGDKAATEQMDRSRPVEEVLEERRAGQR
jgi:hypothetical protein